VISLDHPDPWAPHNSQCHFGFPEGLPQMGSTKQPISIGFPETGASQLRNMNWEKVDIIDYENFLSLGRAFSLTLRLSPIKDGRLPLEVWHPENGNWGERATLKKVALGSVV